MQDGTVIELGAEVVYAPAIHMAMQVTKDLPPPTAAPATKTDSSNSEQGKLAKWGDNNDFPITVMDEVEKNAVLSRGLYWMANAITSGGLVYGSLIVDEATGKSRLQRVKDPVVEAWLRSTNIKRYIREAAHEFYKFWNPFPEMVVSNDRKTIAKLVCHETPWCRWGVQNPNGLIDKCYINAQFGKDGKLDSPETITRDVIDPYYDAVNQVRNNAKLTSFIYPLSGTDSGRAYYPLAPWWAAVTQGWTKIANRIPVYKDALLTNGMTVKYILTVAEWWWQWKYKDWDTKPELKAQRMKEELDAFSAKMKGEKGAGNSLLTATRIIDSKEYKGWSVEAVDDKLKDGALLADVQESTTHILFALGLDGTLIGSLPGSGPGAGSGSDKRVAMNIFIANSKAEQDIILEPVAFAFQYNNFLDDEGLPYEVWFENYWITTLDKGKETQQQSS